MLLRGPRIRPVSNPLELLAPGSFVSPTLNPRALASVVDTIWVSFQLTLCSYSQCVALAKNWEAQVKVLAMLPYCLFLWTRMIKVMVVVTVTVMVMVIAIMGHRSQVMGHGSSPRQSFSISQIYCSTTFSSSSWLDMGCCWPAKIQSLPAWPALQCILLQPLATCHSSQIDHPV